MDKTGIAKAIPTTLLQATRYFSDLDVCRETLVALRWPDGVTCPTCGSGAVVFLKTRKIWKCSNDHTKRQFSVKVGTIFEDSPIGLDKWFMAMWLLGNCKNGISSLELHRSIKVTQKTAWFMLQRIRLAMQRGTFDKPMGENGGEVEADETFIGGLARFMNKAQRRRSKIRGTGGSGKQIVMGLLDRHTGKVRVKHVPNTQRETLQAEIRKHVAPGTTVNTDEWLGYRKMPSEYEHKVINHAESYVNGTVHTNRIENFWSCLKRGLKGTYISVEPFHLFRYLDEQAFRFNERKHDHGDAGRFTEMLSTVAGRRLTYKQLIGKTEDAPTAATV